MSSTTLSPELATGGKPIASLRAYSVAEVAASLGVKKHLVLDWIRSGDLVARDMRAKVTGSLRPRWKILDRDLESFLERRASRPEAAHRRQAPVMTAEPIGRRW